MLLGCLRLRTVFNCKLTLAVNKRSANEVKTSVENYVDVGDCVMIILPSIDCSEMVKGKMSDPQTTVADIGFMILRLAMVIHNAVIFWCTDLSIMCDGDGKFRTSFLWHY